MSIAPNILGEGFDEIPSVVPERRFTRYPEVTASELNPGDLVEFIHEATSLSRRHESKRLVLGINDDTSRIYTLGTTGPSKGIADSWSLSDVGLKPYENKGNFVGWNNTNHVQMVHPDYAEGISFTPLSQVQAIRLRHLFTRIEVAQEDQGVIAAAWPSPEEFVLDALIAHAIEQRGFVFDVNHPMHPNHN